MRMEFYITNRPSVLGKFCHHFASSKIPQLQKTRGIIINALSDCMYTYPSELFELSESILGTQCLGPLTNHIILTFTLQSSPADAIHWPSGENFRLLTVRLCPLYVKMQPFRLMSHSCR